MVRYLWRREIGYGLHYLNKHNPECALKHFRFALSACPVSNRNELNRILYFLGVTLKRLGLNGPAVKSWSAGRTLYRGGYASVMYQRHVNQYGMAKQASVELDDWNAFYSIQLERYVTSKRSRKLGSEGERDMIWDLIYDNWVVLLQSGILTNKSVCEKWRIFSQQEIIFPFFNVPISPSKEPIRVDFQEKSKVELDDPCPCHSGLSFLKCCGRTKSEEEIVYGVF